MPFKMTLFREKLQDQNFFLDESIHHAVWVKEGALKHGKFTVSAGNGTYVAEGTRNEFEIQEDTEILRFEIKSTSDFSNDNAQGEMLLTSEFELPQVPVFLRLDQVSFPPNAEAYRHVHPGPGIRCLVEGNLEIRSDHDVSIIQNGEAWYEDANSPVKATAGDQPAAFVRAMVLPQEYFGKPTINYLDPADHGKLRLQKNNRFFDQMLPF